MTIICPDFETYYDDIFSLKNMTMLEYVTDPRFKVHMLGHDDGVLRPEGIPGWLASLPRPVTLIAQNAQFDGMILSHHYGFVADRYICTRAMAKAWWPHASSSLKFVAERLWPDDPTMRKGEELASSKGVRDFSPELFDTIAGYCQQDVRLTRAAYEAIMAQGFPEPELDIIDIMTRWCVDPAFVLDTELVERYIPKLEDERRRLIADSKLWRFASSYNPDSKQRPQFVKEFEAALRKGTVTPEDREYWLSLKVLNSGPAFLAYLNSVGITPATKRTPAGKLSPALAKNDPAFIEMAAAHPQHAHIWEARKSAKSTQALSRAHRFIDTAARFGGRMPMPVQYNAALTGRAGGAESLNVQNMQRNAEHTPEKPHPEGDLRPGVLRRALCAPPGYKVAVADLSNIEARVLAYLADHEVLLEIFRTGGDPYCWMASQIYGREIIKAMKGERNVGKSALLGCGYGMGVDRFRDYMNSGPMGMAPIYFDDPNMYGYVINTYRSANAPVVSLWALGNAFIGMMATPGTRYEWKMLVIEHERIRLPSGLYLQYPNLRGTRDGWVYDSREEGTEKRLFGAHLIENICQALANCVMKDAMRRAEPRLKALGGRTVLQVHDELVAIVLEHLAQQGLDILLDSLTTVPDWAPGLPVAAEGGYAGNYCK